jgi:putative nucleotidyltransferase with HDIG domain
MLSEKVQSILVSVEKLRPMPSNVTRILKEIDDPKITVTIVSEYVGLDQALAALVLQMANSVALGYGRTCTNLRDAVMRIGLKRLKSLLLASSAAGPLNKSLAGYRLGSGDLWNHSLATAMASELLAKMLNYRDPEEAYVSGLLHDIGKLLLDQFILTDYTKILTFIQQYKMPLWEVEEKLIGIDHARVGGLIGERWQFPVVLVDAIRYHHYPSLARANPQLPAIVNLANAVISQKAVGGNNAGLFSSEIHPETFGILRIQAEAFEAMHVKLLNQLYQ